MRLCFLTCLWSSLYINVFLTLEISFFRNDGQPDEQVHGHAKDTQPTKLVKKNDNYHHIPTILWVKVPLQIQKIFVQKNNRYAPTNPQRQAVRPYAPQLGGDFHFLTILRLRYCYYIIFAKQGIFSRLPRSTPRLCYFVTSICRSTRGLFATNT